MKIKRKMTKNQRKALRRNWSKGIITGSKNNFTKIRKSKIVSFSEQLMLLQCEKLMQEILDNWKSTI